MPEFTGICYIDESGSSTMNEDMFIVVGVWILVEKNTSYLDPFREPIEHIIEKLNMKNYRVKELHTTTMHKELEWIITIIKRWIKSSSYLNSVGPYNQPIVISKAYTKPEVMLNSMHDYDISLPDAMEMTRRTVLSSAISLAKIIKNCNNVSHFKFVLDSEIWRKSLNTVKNVFSDESYVKINTHIRDSHDVPGIQIADLLANATRQKILGNNPVFLDSFSEYVI